MKLQNIISPSVTTKQRFWCLDFGDLRSAQFCALPIRYMAMGERPNPSSMHQVWLFYHELSYIRLLLIFQVQILVGDPHRGNLGSPEITNRFLLIAHDRRELQIWAWSHCACLFNEHRLICNMTYLVQHVNSRDLDLRSNIDLTIQSHRVYVAMRLAERSTMVPEWSCYLSYFKSHLHEAFFAKQLLWCFFFAPSA